MLRKITKNPKSKQSSQSENRNSINLKYWMLLGLLISLAMHGFLHVRPDNMLLLLLNQKATAQSNTVALSNLSVEASRGGRGAEEQRSRGAIRERTNSPITLSSSAPLPPRPPAYPSSIPTKFLKNAPVPDWKNITFKSFVFENDGSIEMPKAEIPGYKSRRVWKAGQSLDRVMELGDEEKILGLENFSLKDIEKLGGTSLQNTNLSEFSVAKWQTVPELVKAIPNLANSRAIDVAPIKDLIEQKLNIEVGANQTIQEVVEQNPTLKDIELGEIDLSKYKLTSIPGIDNSQLKEFSNWQNATISKVPGLNQVSFNNFPIAIAPQGNIVAQVDLPLREVENNRQRSISGSYQEGFNVPCSTNCAHIELAGSDGLTGAQWMSGKFQKVRGGYGILESLNGGKEPTGRHPFGKAFKQVIWDVDEASGSITTAIFFRICKHSSFVDFGCSPYYIGPFNYVTYKEKSSIFVGGTP